jgi:acetylornithine/succinyldiaminopimelate/putrescine aminotransferase
MVHYWMDLERLISVILKQLKPLLNENTAAILIEPIQGEAGINVPPEGYLKAIRELCDEHNIFIYSR